LAYVPISQWQRAWKRYRGGQAKPIWIAALSDSHIERKIPREGSNDFNPMWVGDAVYFLSDRNGPVSLFSYDTRTNEVKQVVQNHGLDIESASAGPDAIVYEQFGSLHLYDLKSGQDHTVDVKISADLPEVRPHFQKIEAKRLRSAGISPTGARAVFEARGEILTVPADKGDVRNLTGTPAAAEREPAWSPDGKWIAYFSDESGEYQLHVRDHLGAGDARRIDLGNPPTFYYEPSWSPDSRRIAYSDKRLNFWVVDLEGGKPVRIDTDTYAGPTQVKDLAWSPDSRWIAYAKQLRNHLHAIFVYSLEQAKKFQMTDGMSDAAFPAFDKEGKYLFLTASTDAALANGWLDMSSLGRPVTRSVYVVVLRKDLPSPVGPESDDEKPGEAAKDKDKDKDKTKTEEKPPAVQIDFENISQRIVPLPVLARNYAALVAGKAGIVPR
jgi:tricorn protease